MAEGGNIEPLREMHPSHAQFINLPKLKRGEHFLTYAVWLQQALEDVPRIRAIWKEHYGKTNRATGRADRRRDRRGALGVHARTRSAADGFPATPGRSCASAPRDAIGRMRKSMTFSRLNRDLSEYLSPEDGC